MKKLLLVVNPVSGTMKAKQHLLAICQIFCQGGFSVTVHVTRSQGDGTKTVSETCGDFDVVVACGGDGTFNEVVAGALQAKFEGAIGYLPCGTTNDTAETSRIPKNILKAAELIVTREATPMDFAAFNRTRFFTYVASFGAFSDVAYSTDQKLKNALGHAAYVTEALGRLKDLRSYWMRVDCDGEQYEGEFLFGAVANALSIGGVVKLKRSGVDLSDGYHEVLLVKNPKKAGDLAQLSKEIISGNYENKSVLLFRGKQISFSCEEAIPWCVDGEYAGTHEKTVIQNLHNRLNFIRP